MEGNRKMKQFIIKSIAIAFLFSIVGCNEETTTTYINLVDTQNQILLKEDSLPPIEYFTLEKVEVPTFGNMFFVCEDSILITVNSQRPKPYIISFHNLNTKEFIAGYIKKGSGPGEMIGVNAELKNKELCIEDLQQNCITRINIDSVLEKKMAYNLSITSIKDGYTGVSFYYNNTDTITLINTWFINGFGAKNIPEFIQIDAKTGKPLKKYKQNEDNFPYNVCLRSVFFDEKSNQYIVPWSKFPVISIYDRNLCLKKQYIGPDNVEINLKQDEWGNIKETGGNTYYYQAPTQENNKILLVNQLCKNLISDDLEAMSEIWIFDVNNGIERRLKCAHEHGQLYSLSYSEKTNTIYVMDYDEGCLFKCVINN